MSFKKTFTLIMRTKESEDIREKNPNSIPVICEKAPHSKIQEIEKTKFLIKKNFTLSQFISIIRKIYRHEKAPFSKEMSAFPILYGGPITILLSYQEMIS